MSGTHEGRHTKSRSYSNRPTGRKGLLSTGGCVGAWENCLVNHVGHESVT